MFTKLKQIIQTKTYEDLVSVGMMFICFIINAILIMIEWGTILLQFNLEKIMFIYWIFWFLALYCLYKCFVTDVSVPHVAKIDTTTYPPCTHCGYGKPERTHHCSQCKKCVYGMDHHCTFIGNCIGHANKKYFVLLMLYITIMMLFVCCIIFPLAIYATIFPKRGPFYHWIFRLFDIIQLFLGVYVIIIISFAYTKLLSGIMCNRTTIESVGMKQLNLWSTHETRRLNKYDLGTLKNLQQIFGTSLWKALLPIDTYNPYQYLHYEYNNECIEQNHFEIDDYEF